MEPYVTFNKVIHDYFFVDEKKGEYIIFSIDNNLIENICIKESIDCQKLYSDIVRIFNKNWSFTLNTNNNGLPNYFGLIAIQVYAAHLRHRDEEYTEKAYNRHLSDLLKINEQALQKLYSNHQETIWQHFKQWCLDHSYFIDIPESKEGKGRYTQYPLSQALLNKEDLKRIPLLFKGVGLKPHELLSFKDFKKMISGADTANIGLTGHYHKLKRDMIEKGKPELLEKQIFSFYCEWDGTIPIVDLPAYKTNTISEKTLWDTLTLTCDLSFTNWSIQLYDQNEELKRKFKVSNRELFEKIDSIYSLPHKDLIIFVKNHDYNNEWNESRYLEFDSSCLLFCKNKGRNYLQECLHMLDKNYQPTNSDNNKPTYSTEFYSIYELCVKSGHNIPQFYKFLFSNSKRPFTVQNGLKISRTSWMSGAGPDFLFEKPVRVWLDGKDKKMDKSMLLSCRDISPGRHVLKIPDYTPFTFSIASPQNDTRCDTPGWQINKKNKVWRPCENNYLISGLTLFFSKSNKVNSPHRDWIEAALSKNNKKQNSNVLIINALKRANNVK